MTGSERGPDLFFVLLFTVLRVAGSQLRAARDHAALSGGRCGYCTAAVVLTKQNSVSSLHELGCKLSFHHGALTCTVLRTGHGSGFAAYKAYCETSMFVL